jgi:MoxR-like ATPase
VTEPARSSPPSPPTGPDSDVVRVKQLSSARDEIVARLRQRIIGQDEVIELLLIALFARGHGLFVGVPGLAKTLLITTLADALSLHSNRIQFTPDLMPSDVTGTDVLEEDATTGKRHFRFIPGPVFTNILLADEVNRAPPKTQAALLQSMAEGQVTASGNTYALEQPYLVFATQNPIEQEGTYPLPEAQLDRFLFQIDVRYPSPREEIEIVKRTTAPMPTKITPVLSAKEIIAFQDLVPRVPVADHVVQHAVALVRASRPEESKASDLVRKNLAFGAGPRASQGLILAAKARAILHGRYAAEIEDVRALVEPILTHRLVMNFRAEAEGVGPSDVIEDIKRSIEP